MADIACTYSLSTPAGTINLNLGTLKDGTDKYWVQNVTGLDGPSIRAPVDNVPFGDGGLVYNFWMGPRHIVFEGVLVTESVGFPSFGDDCITVQNGMEDDLRTALDSILRADGTLSWTPLGLGARSLTVQYEQSLECSAAENYAIKQFVFGLIAGNPNW